MRNFFYFLVKHATFILFLVMETICGLLVFNYNDYHKSAFLSSSNAVCGVVYDAEEGVSQYFNLGSANRHLAAENVELRNRIALLEGKIKAMSDTVAEMTLPDSLRKYNYIAAHVINSSTHRSRNYLTIDCGINSGVKRDMFVINGDGVVGLVSAVSAHYATILPIINTSMGLSVKLAGSNYRGQLKWDGVSPRKAMLEDLPEHAKVSVGDKIVTSGSSAFFPEGIMVGVVDEVGMDKNGGFYKLLIRLAVDFNSIYDVEIVENRQQAEQRLLEEISETDD